MEHDHVPARRDLAPRCGAGAGRALIGRQAIGAFVTLRGDQAASPELITELKLHVGEKIGPIARPDTLIPTGELPKTRSGKIMRRLLRDIAEGRVVGDTTTLQDPGVLDAIKDKYEETE